MKQKVLQAKMPLVDSSGARVAKNDPTPDKKSFIPFVPIEWNGENESGFDPLGDKVLVAPDVVSASSGGGVMLDPEFVDRMTLAAETGTVIAVGEGAFSYNSDKITAFKGRVPKPGERVYIERYAGQTMLGLDGRFYRLMDDKSIGAIAIKQKEVVQ